MSISDDSPSVSSMVVGSHSSQDLLDDISNLPEDEKLRRTFDINEDNDHDEGINDEPQLDDEEELTPMIPINNPIPTTNKPIFVTNISIL
jgi:hypothetical protein